MLLLGLATFGCGDQPPRREGAVAAPEALGAGSDTSAVSAAAAPDPPPTLADPVGASSPGPVPPMAVTGDVVPPQKLGGDPVDLEDPPCREVQGVVIVRAVIDTSGRATDLSFEKPVAPCVDAAVRRALATWTFRPATFQGRPVPVDYLMTMHVHVR
jgi:TonB family protein